ncbi:mediator of RNA polymerase II transcription subunit-like protein [Rhynchospora pubera]|uniref:Mediator of RNA polymerase II transcription subunit-like protein n=1 Tax=Rhynchospora pubera TaxID=906938 RepID=A0AAV8DBZ8_9POAL|nr:mediator of RNA polymerase II transcription subunit-like protein [Rhynchospora pubera]
MDPSEPALKPQWLKSQNGGANGNAISNPNSNGISNKNRLTSLPCDGLRTRDKDRLSKSKAYSSFGTRSNRNRNRNRKQERETDFFDKDSSLVFDRFDSSLEIRSDKDKLRRSRSLISAPVTDIWPDKRANENKSGNSLMDGLSSRNGFLSNKEFPSLKTNGLLETGRHVSSPIERISIESVTKNGGDAWNSVLAEVPLTGGTVGSGANRSSANGSVKETVHGLNMAQAVAQAPAHDRSMPQLMVDPQKIDELTIKQCKQLIPLTAANKNMVARSAERLKSKGLAPVAVSKAGTHPLNPSPRGTLKAENVAKPMSQLGTFQILNRERNGTVFSPPAPTINPIDTTTKVSTTPSKGKSTVSKQAKKDKDDFFNFLRNQASSNGTDSSAETGSDSSPTAVDNGSDEVKSENDEEKSENWVCDKDHCEDSRWDPPADEENVFCQEMIDPEERAFLLSLGWDANAEVAALTEEEIDSFKIKYKERKQFSMLSQQKILGMS